MKASPNKRKLIQLLEKYQKGKATPKEQAFVEWYYQQFDAEPSHTANFSEYEKTGVEQQLWEKINATINKSDSNIIPFYKRRYWQVAALVAFLLLAGGTGYFFLNRQENLSTTVKTNPAVHDLLPGGNKAVLTLSNGKQVSLQNATNGQIADGAIKTADGKLQYKDAKTTALNTLSTPRGGQYFVQLSDGTKVWLNAASSITFPTAFNGKERSVTMTGEAYFEIVHNAHRPFHIKVNGMDIQDIGTAFNVNAYADETNTKTTLISGAVNITAKDKITLHPGQQAQTSRNGKIALTSHIDIDDVLSWKYGYFSFEGADLHTLMRQIGRWYDVDIMYQGAVPEMHFGGKIPRNSNASEVLQMLGYSGVHFKIDGKKIIVTP